MVAGTMSFPTPHARWLAKLVDKGSRKRLRCTLYLWSTVLRRAVSPLALIDIYDNGGLEPEQCMH
jgi:hypothetical protein